MAVDLHHPTFIEQERCANPLLNYQGLIPFEIIEPDHFLSAVAVLSKSVLPQIERLERVEKPTWETLIDPLEEIEEKIHRIVGPITHLKLVKDSPALREAWSVVEPLINQLELRIKQSHPIYEALETLKASDQWKVYSSAQKRNIERRLLDAKLKGIHLNREKLDLFNTLIFRLSKLQNAFVANILDATKQTSFIVTSKKELEGVPYPTLKFMSESYNNARDSSAPPSTPQEGPWKLSLTPHVFLNILRHCKCRTTRELLYREQIQKASKGEVDNSQNLTEQLKIRKELANLLGYKSYAELSLATKMAPDVETVNHFLEQIREASWVSGREDLLKVQLFAARNGFKEPFMPWDYSYWSERHWEEWYHLSEEEMKPYFPLPKILNGLFDLCNKLFGITIVKPENQPPVWHPDVTYYLIHDEDGEQIASFYLDPFTRPQTKRGGAWTETCLNRTVIDGKLQLPIAYIVCNSTPPIGDAPALLTFRELETLFHEFGHGLQHMLTTINYGSISGTNGIEWDAIEMASKFMENWCYHKSTLRNLTAHYQTGEPIPEVLIDKILSARNYNAGTNTLVQLKYSLCDLSLHSDYDPSSTITPFDVYHEKCLTTSHLPCLEDDYFLCSFHHIFGGDSYAAGYYSYKWAEVLSADAFAAFLEVGEEDWSALRTVGEKFKTTFLQLGGSVHPMEVFETFRGRAPTIDALLTQSGFTK
ncbi:MAG: M3 family metallopeptidase [Chlamydiia bacterium]|nr:M3 family metallopeptidase [Chlamydiia bacterium]